MRAEPPLGAVPSSRPVTPGIWPNSCSAHVAVVLASGSLAAGNARRRDRTKGPIAAVRPLWISSARGPGQANLPGLARRAEEGLDVGGELGVVLEQEPVRGVGVDL